MSQSFLKFMGLIVFPKKELLLNMEALLFTWKKSIHAKQKTSSAQQNRGEHRKSLSKKNYSNPGVIIFNMYRPPWHSSSNSSLSIFILEMTPFEEMLS